MNGWVGCMKGRESGDNVNIMLCGVKLSLCYGHRMDTDVSYTL